MHEEHRQHVYSRFLREGLEGFEPHQVLELLLFYTLPRQDTNPLAHELLTHFGTLAGVFNAHPGELMKVKGVGERTAILLSMLPQILRMYQDSARRTGIPMDNTALASEHVLSLYAARTREVFYLICLDNHCRLIQSVQLHEGTVNEIMVHPRIVVEAALRTNATQVIFAHNHPGGSPDPSREDEVYTRRVAVALATIGIPVVDHFIISDGKLYSFHKNGKMDEIRREVSVRIAQELTPYRFVDG